MAGLVVTAAAVVTPIVSIGVPARAVSGCSTLAGQTNQYSCIFPAVGQNGGVVATTNWTLRDQGTPGGPPTDELVHSGGPGAVTYTDFITGHTYKLFVDQVPGKPGVPAGVAAAGTQ